ncbi:MAG: RNA-directed DNA polymerase [Nitrospiraceae bacterium]
MWLVRTVIFHDCTRDVVFKTDRQLWRHIPPHKTLFGTENQRGLPIGNLSSQFFSNVYLNELDQFVKHHLKASQYLRYSDDVVLLHEDQAQLLAWRATIQAFLAERLRLRLTDPCATPRPIQNGVDFLGYIVRPDYLLVRRRVVQRLKVRLTGYEARLVRRRPGWMVFTHDAARLAALRASWASSLSHMNMAQTYRLRQALLRRWWWLRHFFTLDDGLLTPREPPETRYPCLKAQYDAVTRRYPGALVACQVGCFVELYDATAEQAIRRLRLSPVQPRRGFQCQCGVPQCLWARTLSKLLTLRLPPLPDAGDRGGPRRGERQVRCRVLAAGRGQRFATNRHE